MKLLNLLTMAGLATACAHDHDDKEWTKEELDELEQKWGYEVGSDLLPESPSGILSDICTDIVAVAIRRHQHLCPPQPCQVSH